MADHLVGECNRCGQCCTYRNLRCANLVVAGKLGEPEATRCAAYAWRFEGMPIYGVDALGSVEGISRCRKDSENETRVVRQWIGRGCSLREAA